MISPRWLTTGSGFRRVSLNSLWLLGARFGSQALMLLFTVLVARYLGETGLGQYAFIASVIFVGNVLTTFGLDTLLIRDVSAARAGDDRQIDETLSAALLVQIGLSLLFAAAIWLFAGLLPNQTAETLTAFRIAVLSLLPLAFSTVYSAVLRAYERMDLYMAFNLATTAAMTLGALLVLSNGGGLIGLAVVIVAAQSAGALASAAFCRALPQGFSRRWLLPCRAALRRALQLGGVLAALTIVGVLTQRLNVMLLSLLVGDAAAGWYSAAMRLVEATKVLPFAFFGALFPVFARRFSDHQSGDLTTKEPDDAFISGYRRGFYVLLVLCGLAAAAITMLAEPLIRLLYGPGYEPSVRALQILIWSLPPAVFAMRYSVELVARGRERPALLASVVTLLIALGLNLLVLPRWGLLGSCVAFVLAEVSQTVLLWRLNGARLNKRTRIRP